MFLLNVAWHYVPLRRVNPDILEALLREHPDRQMVQYVVQGFRTGFDLGLTRQPPSCSPCKNLREARRKPHIAQAMIDEEVRKGHMAGPFKKPPFPDMVFSPVNLVPKAGAHPDAPEIKKYRLIHDLSHPYNDNSVNACIPKEASSVHYTRIDDVIHKALQIGVSAVSCRIDIRAAFRNAPLNFKSIRVLGLSLNGKIYINICLPFGAATSCAIFEKIATALQWVIVKHTSITWIDHYLDDYILLARCLQTLEQQMDEFLLIMQRIGMPIAEEKTLGPAPVIEFLGLVLDFLRQLITIPEKKRAECLRQLDFMLQQHDSRQKVTVRDIQKLAGHLNFICQALPAGRPFLASLYRLTASKPGVAKQVRAGHQRRINQETAADLRMFQRFLQEKADISEHSVPFLNRIATFQDSVQLFADSAGNSHLGFGCVFKTHWAYGRWENTSIFKQGIVPNIALLELYAIVIALELWAPRLQGMHIILRSDSSATVGWLTRKRSPIPAAMQLIRHLTLTCLHFQILIKAIHIEGALNQRSDWISRGRLNLLRQQYPEMDREPMPLPPSLWPPSWTRDQMLSTEQNAQHQITQARWLAKRK